MTHLSFQLRQVRNLHELYAPVLVPYRLSLVTPEDNTDYSQTIHFILGLTSGKKTRYDQVEAHRYHSPALNPERFLWQEV